MNETELRDGLHEVIAASSPPPPMDAVAVLDAARRARIRRRAVWAGSGAAAGVVAIAVGTTVALSGGWTPSRLTGPAGPGAPSVTGASKVPGQGTSAPPGTGLPQGTGVPQGEDTKTPWPTGPDGSPQQDRTANAGPRNDTGARLLDELVAVVPPGYTVPQGEPGPNDDPWVRYHQAQFAERVDGVEVWEYLASLAVQQGGNAGRLFVEVHTPRNNLPADPCELARSLWGLGGDCELVDIGGTQVGVVVHATDGRGEFDQWAAYRHADGTVVFVAQAQRYRGLTAGLPQPLFTVQQLTELATADRFHVQ